MNNTVIDKYAKTIWDYMLMKQKPGKSDIILALGSRDLNTAQRACDLYFEGYAPVVIFSGKHGHEAVRVLEKTEAERYRKMALNRGVPPNAIFLENESTNTGDNIKFTRELVLKNKLKSDKVILVQKPYMERRSYSTFKKIWPEPEVLVTSSQISYEEYTDNNPYYDKARIINYLVGDLVKIKEYPKLSFQIEQEIPDNVWQAGQELIKLGYNQKLPKLK